MPENAIEVRGLEKTYAASGGNAPKLALKDYLYNENRYRMLRQIDPVAADAFLKEAQQLVHERWAKYEALAHPAGDGQTGAPPPAPRPKQAPPEMTTPPTGAPVPSTKPVGVRPAGPPGVKPAGPPVKKATLPPKD